MGTVVLPVFVFRDRLVQRFRGVQRGIGHRGGVVRLPADPAGAVCPGNRRGPARPGVGIHGDEITVIQCVPGDGRGVALEHQFAAGVAEGQSADHRHRRRQGNLAQAVAPLERALPDGGKSFAQRHGCQRLAVVESPFGETRQRGGQRNLRQRDAVIESVFAQRFNLPGQRCGSQRPAVVKRVVTDFGQVGGKCQALQRFAIAEGVIADRRYRIRYVHGRQRRASFESEIANFAHRGRNSYGLQRLAIAEHRGFDDRQAFVQGHVRQRLAADEYAAAQRRHRAGQPRARHGRTEAERAAAYRRHAVGHIYPLQRRTVAKSPTADSFQPRIQIDDGQRGTADKSIFADFRHRSGHIEAGQARTFRKYGIRQHRQRLGQPDGLQCGAAGKNAVTDPGHAVREKHVGQRRRLLERAARQGGYAVGNRHAFDGRAIFERARADLGHPIAVDHVGNAHLRSRTRVTRHSAGLVGGAGHPVCEVGGWAGIVYDGIPFSRRPVVGRGSNLGVDRFQRRAVEGVAGDIGQRLRQAHRRHAGGREGLALDPRRAVGQLHAFDGLIAVEGLRFHHPKLCRQGQYARLRRCAIIDIHANIARRTVKIRPARFMNTILPHISQSFRQASGQTPDVKPSENA